MQDIDFDELDRAVSSVANPDQPVEPRSDEVPVRSTPKTDSPAARRGSSGRFMDVVHPSSDMRSSSVPARSEPRSDEPEVKDESSTDLPDPIDFHMQLDQPIPTPSETPQDTTEDPVAEGSSQSLESPFLSGTKVEKRPLNAFPGSGDTDSKPEIKDETPLLEAPDDPLLEAEATPDDPVNEPVETVTTPEIEETPMPEAATVTPAPEETSSVPTSITQQYKEQPSTTDQPSGAIFDTEAYHQALVHTPKKRGGAMVVVWIAALILVGAGAGAAVYFFVLPML